MGTVVGSFKNLDVTLRFLGNLSPKSKLAMTFAAGAMATKAKAYCEDIISARDHSLRELALMGHPYAAAHPANPHDPPETVHVQDGDLIAGLTATAPIGTAHGAQAKVINTDPVDEWIQGGSEKMIARPYMHRVKEAHGDEILEVGKSVLAQRLSEELKRSA
jgi:hypothetical protein